MSRRILVMRGGALGDFVLGLPALERLRGAYPRAHLQLIGPPGPLPLASSLADSTASIESPDLMPLFGDADELPRELVQRFGGLDLAVLWMADREGVIRRNLQRLGAGKLLWAPALPARPGVHAADYLLGTLNPLLEEKGLAAPTSPAVPVVYPREAALAGARELWRRLGLPEKGAMVVVHPGSGGERKRWPAEGFAGVLDRLNRAGVTGVVIEGPADEAAVAETLARIRGEVPAIARGMSVEMLAAFLSLAGCYLGNDSGVTHLAAAVGTPTVALFGPTDPRVWGPRGERVAVLRRGEELAAITVDEVVDAVEGWLWPLQYVR